MNFSRGSIAECFNARENNLDLLRLFAAILVIFSHSFPLSLGSNASEPFVLFTKGQETFGGLGVSIFFVISGFLITYSFERSANVYAYMRNRILRIYPALLVVLLISVFVLGPLVTSLSVKEYLMHPATIKYLESFMLINMQYSLPGVFENNPYPNAVNGSLWTLWYEMFFYMVVAILGLTRLLKKHIIIPLFLAVLFIAEMIDPGMAIYHYIELFKYFSAGMVVYLCRDKIKLNHFAAIASLAILCIFAGAGLYRFAFALFGAYLIFHIGFGVPKLFKTFQEKGDFSYGMYIYAFPVQQTVAYLLEGNITPIQNFVFATPIILGLSILSWFLIEKKCLALKNKAVFRFAVVFSCSLGLGGKPCLS
ncbi:acyltransferase [Thermobacillus sp.]|uniref:acyltransferase family protein n=1 Tax=Thermobacillus sp. TaxID=2108467 RepID=UPI00257DCF99|nr:acyltransferase [Thermobacillus sp.]